MNFSRVMGLLARNFGDREALVNVERNRRYTYRELHACTNRVANMLRDTLKLRTGDKLMLILDNDNMSLMHFMATWKQEATAVYTNFRDSLEEHSWQVELVRPRVVFVESACVARYHAMLRRHGCTIVAMDPLPEPLDGYWTSGPWSTRRRRRRTTANSTCTSTRHCCASPAARRARASAPCTRSTHAWVPATAC